MRAVDTKIVVRLIIRDDARQAAAADAYIAPGAWVSCLTLAEAAWVLRSVYDFAAPKIAQTIRMPLQHDKLVLQDSDAVSTALGRYREHPAISFADCLILETARKAGHLPLGAFDRALGRAEGAERIR